MAKEYAKAFYNSKEWQRCRSDYMKSVNYLCEDCMAKGIYKPADHVHHIEHITPMNINNPEITLNHDNLRALCIDCHNKEHHKDKTERRYEVDEQGRVIF